MTIMIIVLTVAVLGLGLAVFALARQVGILFERVAPLGALVIDAGPGVGEAAPVLRLPTLSGTELMLGAPQERSTLLFFLSPTCPVCKKLLPILRSLSSAEAAWLDIVLASDGDEPAQRRFVEVNRLQAFAYVLSADLGVKYRVSRLPFAVLIDERGVVRAKGLINNREQLESLFRAKEMGVGSIQQYLDQSVVTQAR